MFKHFFSLLIVTLAIHTFALFGNNLSELNYGSILAKTTPTPTKQVSIKSVSLDKTEATILCPFRRPTEGETADCSEEKYRVNISSEITASIDNLEYYYTVSTGEIIGKGKNVVWRFTKSPPGKHRLTVGIGKDGIIIGDTISKTVTLTQCPSCCELPCACPDIKFNPPPKEVKVGDIIVLSVESEVPELDITYARWTIENGEIINGQGTKKVLVKVSKMPKNGILKYTVEVRTSCEECIRTNTDKVKITK